MASDNSFDVVSKVELQEVKNAIDQATKEVHARFDLKDSKSKIELEGTEAIQLASQDEYTLKAVIEILSQKLVKRGVSLKNLEYEKIEPAANSSVRQKIKLIQGIPSEKAKQIVAAHQGLQEEGPGQHSGRYRPRRQQRPRRSAGDHGHCFAARISASTSSSPTSAPTNATKLSTSETS